jgi:predicted ribosomally synthesized peptide with nif11-like leader
MSFDQMNALLEAAAANREVAARFTEVTTAQQAAEVAADLGFDVTAEEIEAAGAHAAGGQLSDAELAGVAGGGSPSLDPMLCPTGHCQSMYGLGCG